MPFRLRAQAVTLTAFRRFRHYVGTAVMKMPFKSVSSAMSGLWLVVCLLAPPVSSRAAEPEDPPAVEEVVVTGSRIGRTFSELSRQVTVIEGERLKDLPGASVPEILRLAAGADVRERTAEGVQADIALRAASYQQVLILVDGVRVNDPQTAHHNMDLPVPLEEIERIEVLHGHGSSAWGADAFGGVVNIITKRPARRSVAVEVRAAQDNTNAFCVSAGEKIGRLSQRISVERRSSDGFAFDRDYRSVSVLSKSLVEDTAGETGLTAGFLDRDFGAFDFYTPGANLPSRESTRTYLASAERSQNVGPAGIKAQAFLRRHCDRFVLDMTRPDFYVNDHVTDHFGGMVQAEFRPATGLRMMAGSELAQDRIASDRIGDHGRATGAVFAECAASPLHNWDFIAGLRMDESAWGRQFSPSGGLSWRAFPRMKLRASAGRSFRVPSFTELYYRDPLNEGNPALRPETAACYELGADLAPSPAAGIFVTAYARDQGGVIDWAGDSAAGPWHARNTGRVFVTGAELAARAAIGPVETVLGSAWARAEREGEGWLKYGLSYAARTLSANLVFPSGLGTKCGLSASYRKRADGREAILAGARLSRRAGRFGFYVEAQNILDREYEDVTGVPGPGRWIGAGASFDRIWP